MVSANVNVAEVAAVGIFNGLAPEALENCASLAVRRELSSRRLIFSQGEPCTRFQALLSGCIRISQAGPDGGAVLLRFVGPGEPFGFFGMVVDGRYPAEGTAIRASLELSWSQAHFRQLVENYPNIAVNLVALAARRLTELQERLREVTTLPAEQRIANALLRLSNKHGHRLADGRVEIICPLTRKDVAAISATALHTASRTMAAWERNGIVASAKKRVLINCIATLAQIADAAL